MTEADKKRIEEATEKYTSLLHHINPLTEEACCLDFKAGAGYEHPIAYNQAIEDVTLALGKMEKLSPEIIETIQKLKK